jgi:predicted ribosome quality control (RQC) complex YloA/Tae2 family protein
MSALDIAAVVKELSALLPARVNSVHSPASNTVALEVYSQKAGRTLTVVLDADGFVFFTPNQFKTLERSQLLERFVELRGAWVHSCTQLDFDRVVKIEFSGGYATVLELLSKGNIMLLKEGRVVAALDYIKVKGRRIEPGAEYTPPPVRGAPLDQPLQVSGASLIQALSRVYNAPAELLEEGIRRAGRNPLETPAGVPPDTIERIRRECISIIEQVKGGNTEPNVVREGELFLSFHPVKFVQREGTTVVALPTMNEAVSTYYESFIADKVSRQATAARASAIEAKLASAKKSRETAEEYKTRAKEIRRVAHTILENTDAVSTALGLARRKEFEKAKALLDGLSLAAKSATGIAITLEGNVELDPRLTPFINANRLFERAKELERKGEEALKVASRLEEEARLAEEKRSSEQASTRLHTILRRKWFEKYRWFYTSTRKLVIAGRDSSQNQSIVRRFARKGCTALHADIQGAPLTLITEEADGQSLLEAACFAASYSKAWQEELASVDVFYADGSEVSVAPASGEYLPKGGVIFHRKEWLKGVKLGLRIGLYQFEHEKRVAVWPSVTERDWVVEIAPGRLDRNVASKRIIKILVTTLAGDPYVDALRVDDILPLLPGRCSLRTKTG